VKVLLNSFAAADKAGRTAYCFLMTVIIEIDTMLLQSITFGIYKYNYP